MGLSTRIERALSDMAHSIKNKIRMLERGPAAIGDPARTVLSAADREVVLGALATPASPTDALRAAMALHDARVMQDPRGISIGR